MPQTPNRPPAALAGPLLGLRRAGRVLLLVFLVLGAAAAWHWRAFLDPKAISGAIAGSPLAPLLFLAAQAVASLVFVPRTILAIVAGLLFGIGWGLFWAVLGSVVGAIAGFLVIRYVNSGLIDLEAMGFVGPLVERLERGGWRAVAVLRLIPVMPHSLANYGLGLTRVPLGAYTFGSLVGQLPMTVAYVELGAAGQRLIIGGEGWIAPTVIGFAALLLSTLIPALARRRARG
ncbi:MAG TPA: VTT domain-containing protein [Stellaceae bacterium]|nr:VTT domain-containing protein [Stellaceae bacterium]